MKYWILKTEPTTYSFEQLLKDKKTCWDGVRNYTARNNLRAMEVGDLALIYHSGETKAAVGLAKVVKKAYQDPKTDEDWSAVDLAPVNILKKQISLSEMKSDKLLKTMVMVRQSRLSVSPLSKAEYERLLDLASK